MKDLGWGLSMTLYGMGTVFLLLIVLMLILLAIGFLDSRSMKKKQNRQEQSAAVEAQTGAAVADEAAEAEAIEPADLGIEILHDGLTRDQVAAITVAVMIHARVRRAQAAPAMRTYEPGSHLYASRWVTSGRGQQNTSWRRN